MRVRRCLVLTQVAVAAACAGCASPSVDPATVSQTAVSQSPVSRSAVSESAAGQGAVDPLDQVLSRFVAANNAANAARDDALLRTVESGTSLALDLAGYAVSRFTDPTGGRSGAGFDLVEPTWWVTSAGGPRWAVVRAHGRSRAAGSASSPSPIYLAFARDTPGGPWLQEYAVDVDPGAAGQVPDPVGAGAGAASACSGSSDSPALSRLVSGWLAALRQTRSGRPGSVAGERFLALRQEQLGAERLALAGLGGGGEIHEPRLVTHLLDRRPERVVSLRLPDGGCLVLFATQERRGYRATTSAGLTLAGAYRALGGAAAAPGLPLSVDVTSIDQWLAVVPPDGAGRPGQILGHAGRVVDVRPG